MGILFFISILSHAQEPPAHNQAIKKVTSIQRIMLQASQEVMDAENSLNMEIVHLQFDLINGTDWKWTYRTLHPGWIYAIYAAGENGMISDLDLRVEWQHPETKEWTLVQENTDPDNQALIIAKPQGAPLRYAIGVKAAKYANGFSGGHYFILVAHAAPNTE